ncbi:MAG TPA: aldose epimerase family protein [Solirubrobacteraceae bacterium]|nr:aldose epimerase family protein [Solirubrobacteraceae bacterium]
MPRSFTARGGQSRAVQAIVLVIATMLIGFGAITQAALAHGHRAGRFERGAPSHDYGRHDYGRGGRDYGAGRHDHGSHSGRGQNYGGGFGIATQPWGTVEGHAVSLYTLSNGNGMKVSITNYGGIVQAIDVPSDGGQLTDVVLGFDSLADYVKNDEYPQPSGGSGTTYFGAIVGRYANRIANGEFTLNGTTYQLPKNNGENTLHGGPGAYSMQAWQATPTTSPEGASLKLEYTDPDGHNGFPGTVTNTVTYTLTGWNSLRIDYKATTDKTTVVNFTNHSYFNLAGEGSGTVNNQILWLNANNYTPINSSLIPTGQIAPVANTPLDFTHAKPIGQDINSGFEQLVLAHGYDFNWVLNRQGPGLSLAARAEDPASGRTLTAYTTEPGIQLYTGNFLAGELVGPSGHTYRQTDAFTLETQHYPDSPNQPSFPSTVLKPGETFRSTTVYAFSGGRH